MKLTSLAVVGLLVLVGCGEEAVWRTGEVTDVRILQERQERTEVEGKTGGAVAGAVIGGALTGGMGGAAVGSVIGSSGAREVQEVSVGKLAACLFAVRVEGGGAASFTFGLNGGLTGNLTRICSLLRPGDNVRLKETRGGLTWRGYSADE